MNIAIIPARGGSQRIPGKNRRLFHGRPIISYSIEAAKQSKIFDEIIVSTDDKDIVRIAKAYGAKVHMRPERYCRDEVGTQEVVKVCLHWWNVCHPNRRPSIVCCIYATAPLMLPDDLVEARTALGDQYIFPRGPDLMDAGQWYMGKADNFLKGLPLAGNSTNVFLPAERVMDINTEEQWQAAELMYAALQEENRERTRV